jgi:hypothetical protein
MKNLKWLVPIVILGCSGAREGTKAGAGRDPLYADEIAQSGATNAYEAVRMRRPMFFYSRGVKTLYAERGNSPVVYLNNSYYGDLESLRNITAESIAEIRYLTPSDATMQFGTGHANGVIQVISRTGAARQ